MGFILGMFTEVDSRSWCRGKDAWVKCGMPVQLEIQGDVMSRAPTLLLDLSKERRFIPVRFGIVVIGDGVEPGSFPEPTSHKGVGHADDRRGIHSSAEIRKDGGFRAKPPSHRFAKNRSKVLLVLSIVPIPNSLVRIKLPVLPHGCIFRAQ